MLPTRLAKYASVRSQGLLWQHFRSIRGPWALRLPRTDFEAQCACWFGSLFRLLLMVKVSCATTTTALTTRRLR
eukprot:1860146-Pleurochrysis_carterae.AAC.1